MRVREQQLGHLSSGSSTVGTQNDSESRVKAGALCLFKRVDCQKILVGRVVQFSYIEGNKREMGLLRFVCGHG